MILAAKVFAGVFVLCALAAIGMLFIAIKYPSPGERGERDGDE